MHEIELKFQVSPAQRGAVDAAVVGRTGRTGRTAAMRTRTRLQAAYHDTPERTLAQAGLALRMRREGRRWVQTLKGATDDGMTRLEHNVPRGSTAAMPPIDVALHAGTPAGAALQACLANTPAPALTEVYRTDVLRRTRALRTPHGRVELALDTGRINAGERHAVVLELEIELLTGSPRAVLDTARAWLPRFGLWLDVRSKAERGDLLARGLTIAPARPAADVKLAPQMTAAMARQTVLRSCADQILANASQVASGEHASEHVHQLRVGLRRLRSALQLFEPAAGDAELTEAAAVLFRRLGAARDLVVIDAEFGAELRAAMHSAGVTPEPIAAVDSGEPSPTEVLRAIESQMLLLGLLAATQTSAIDEAGAADAAEPAAPLHEQLAKRLSRWHRQLIGDAKRFTELDDASRHQLRKRAKRLRYASEFCGALFEPRALRRYLKRLRALQERLGALSDVLMAMQSFAQQRERDPAALFALGWLAARREVLIAAAAPELKAFAKVERFWKRG
jgi:triphosphatase